MVFKTCIGKLINDINILYDIISNIIIDIQNNNYKNVNKTIEYNNKNKLKSGVNAIPLATEIMEINNGKEKVLIELYSLSNSYVLQKTRQGNLLYYKYNPIDIDYENNEQITTVTDYPVIYYNDKSKLIVNYSSINEHQIYYTNVFISNNNEKKTVKSNMFMFNNILLDKNNMIIELENYLNYILIKKNELVNININNIN